MRRREAQHVDGFLSLDVGGTKIKAAVVLTDGRLLSPAREYSAGAGDARPVLVERFFAIVQEQLDAAGAKGVSVLAGCVGFPGPFDYEQGVCLLQGIGKYDALYGLNLRRLLEGKFGFPFYFFNDAALFLVGACNLAEAKRYQKVCGVCLGTGIGSAFYDRPWLVKEGADIPKDGYIYSLPFKDGILDEYLSATGLRREIARAGLDITDVHELADLARDEKEQAIQIFQEFGKDLASVLPDIAQKFGARCLVLGGKIAGAADLFAASLRHTLEKRRIRLLVLPDSSNYALRAAAFLLAESRGQRYDYI